MAEFAGGSQSFKHYPFVEIDSNMELANQIDELNPSGLENAVLNLQNFLGFSNDSFLTQHQPELAMLFADNIPNFSYPDCSNAAPVAQSMALPGDALLESKKHKKMEVSESSSGNSSTPVSETGLQGDDKIKRKNSSGRRKRGRSDDKEVEKPKEVIHVRARRGQATDNHSLAERVRRQKINERLRCLQDIVPGCHKTMGMAVMLDEIINYVQSLQNQVEFLSMKLSAASSASDYSSEMEAMGAYQGTNAYEAQEVERLVREGYGGFTCYHSTWPL